MKVYYFNDPSLSGITNLMADSLVEFIRKVWDPAATKERIILDRQKEYQQNPYSIEGGMPLLLLADGDKVVGHVKSTPCKVWAAGKESLAFWNSGLHLLDECRGKGLGIVLPQKIIETLPIVTGFFVVEQQLRTHKKMGWSIVGKIPEYIKILNPKHFFQLIDISGIEQMPEKLKKLTRNPNSPLRVCAPYLFYAVMGCFKIYNVITKGWPQKPQGILEIVDSFDNRVDALWERSKQFITCAQVRNSEYMNWQFNAKDGWIKAIYKEEGIIQGYAILSIKSFEKDHRLSGLKVFSIIDILWDFSKPTILTSMLSLIEDYARKQNPDVLLCSIANKEAYLRLYSNGFLKIPGTVYFAFHAIDGSLGLSSSIEDWFFTRGDADAAGSLGPKL